MADYFVASGGSNTSPYDTWAKAATSLATALAAATTAGDRVIIQYDGVPSGDAEVSSDTTYTVVTDIKIITSTNSGTSTITPTPMGTANWIGNSTLNRTVAITANSDSVYIYGLTLRTAGSTGDTINLVGFYNFEFENCYFWQGNTSTSGAFLIGSGTETAEVAYKFKDCTFRFGNAAQELQVQNAVMVFENCTVSSDGTAPSRLILGISCASGPLLFDGCDLSYVNTTLVADQTNGSRTVTFRNCKLPSSYTAMDAQTAPGKAGAEVWLFDCYSGDEHIHIGHYNGYGETTISTGIYANDNIADTNLSWKIVGTAGASAEMPYESPWIEVYHTGTSAITPYLEICRSGSATAYNNNEVWSEWAYKGTSGSTKVTFVNDGMALAGSAAAQTNSSKSASDWTGENATSWFGKLAPASSFTPAEAGHIRARVRVAGANTVYVDPQIRGLS